MSTASERPPATAPASDLTAARAVNASSHRKADSVWLAVPVVPTVGMLRLALAAKDAIAEGDRAGDWIALPDAGDLDDALIHPSLAEEFGREEAARLCVAYDVWSGCLSGLDEWTSRRAIEGSNAFVDGWLRPMVDRCPSGGWPADKSGETETHRAFAAERGDPFVHGHVLDAKAAAEGRGIVVAPVRACGIMGLRGAQAELGFVEWSSASETIRTDAMPWIPGHVPENRNDDEERPWVLAAALWRGAVGHVLEGVGPDVPFPEHPDAQGIRLKNLVSSAVSAAMRDCGLSGFESGPWASATIASSAGIVKMSVEDGRFSWSFEDVDRYSLGERGTRLSADVHMALWRSIRRVRDGGDVHVVRMLAGDGTGRRPSVAGVHL